MSVTPFAVEPVAAPAKPRPLRAAARLLFRLRPEEAGALLFLLPTTYLSVAAASYARQTGVLGDRLPGGLVRLTIAVGLLAALGLARRAWPASRAVATLRDVVPFVACILIYTNLHDTIGFVNGHDVHLFLDALDRELFGVQPTVWAERFITPARTEAMQFLYLNFFWIAPSMSLLMLARKRWAEFRTVTLGVIVCFYLGYLLYVLFPAAPPRLVLVYEFKRSLSGHPSLFSNLSARAFELLPADSRAAFPSLHAAASLVVLIYAWRHLRAWFWAVLPFVLGLWTSTVYLRHHYAVDVLAGWALAPVAVAVAPRLDAWWEGRRRALGLSARPPGRPTSPR